MSIGSELITNERQRQISTEGWTLEHDDDHVDQEMAQAACYYAWPMEFSEVIAPDALFPFNWHESWAKRDPEDTVRNLVKAGALIAAEIDRLLRADLIVRDDIGEKLQVPPDFLKQDDKDEPRFGIQCISCGGAGKKYVSTEFGGRDAHCTICHGEGTIPIIKLKDAVAKDDKQRKSI